MRETPGPEIRTTASAERPAGVARAAIVSRKASAVRTAASVP